MEASLSAVSADALSVPGDRHLIRVLEIGPLVPGYGFGGGVPGRPRSMPASRCVLQGAGLTTNEPPELVDNAA